jgi:hypothetical protein
MSWRSCGLSLTSFTALFSHVKVRKYCRLFRKKGPFITLGRNVAAKLEEKHVEKCHRLWDKILQRVSLSHCDKQSKVARFSSIRLLANGLQYKNETDLPIYEYDHNMHVSVGMCTVDGYSN